MLRQLHQRLNSKLKKLAKENVADRNKMKSLWQVYRELNPQQGSGLENRGGKQHVS